MKIIFLIILIISALFINAGFSVVSRTSNSITVRYEYDSEMNGSAVLLPPTGSYNTVFSDNRQRISTSAISEYCPLSLLKQDIQLQLILQTTLFQGEL